MRTMVVSGHYNIGKFAYFDQLFDQNATGSACILSKNGLIRKIINSRANSFKRMYHEPWVARRNLDSTGTMVEIEPKWAHLDFGSIPPSVSP